MSYGHTLQPRCTEHPSREAVTRDGTTYRCMACTLQALRPTTDAQPA